MRYQGSRILESFAHKGGLRLFEINFLFIQIAGIIVSLIMRNKLKPKPKNTLNRHLFCIFFGIIFGLFFYGHHLLHVIVQSCMVYYALKIAPQKYAHVFGFTISMVYLSYLHYYFQNIAYWSDTIDVTSQSHGKTLFAYTISSFILMISTQKLILISFSFYDGQKQREKLKAEQEYFVVQKFPEPVEFFGYILNFQGIIVGPSCSYRDYADFIEGNNLKTRDQSETKEPSIRNVLIKKIITLLILCYASLLFKDIFQIKKNISDGIYNSPIWFRIFYMYMTVLTRRFNYYFAWVFADIVHNASGFGYNGYDQKWDLITNVKIFSLETSTSIKSFIDNWNIQTRLWLRRTAYERLPFAETVGVFILSPLWHGFYAGYYLTFFSILLFVLAGKKIRKYVKPLFSKNVLMRLIYALLSWISTMICLSYLSIPFELYDFYSGIRFYNSWYWCLHIAAFMLFCILKLFVHQHNQFGFYFCNVLSY
ncbi:membrane-bound O-acyltransferase domain-containing 2-like [Brachionus plicatilis]|uniref:Membrane-bound O-acyltransferase domain-containing 2-like n=1 Tax=Brachionus plicatilis TaxID=10195 RepID=A0A3M7RCA0_BRAPC|nr:membrane-bound O-acyltransferase domain-containing 2-like [Brachionus plicatilis]